MTVAAPAELESLIAAGRVVEAALDAMEAAVGPDVTTAELDAVARAVFARAGARSAPELVYDFPGATCISVNDEAVHGIPSGRALRSGDLVKLDVTAELDGYFADAARTVFVGVVSTDALRVARAAQAALAAATSDLKAGARLADLGGTIEAVVEEQGCCVLRDLTGHGIGRSIHEEPEVLNFRTATEEVLEEGQVITVEPIISLSTRHAFVASDRWTVKTRDGSLSAHAEQTLLIERDGVRVLAA